MGGGDVADAVGNVGVAAHDQMRHAVEALHALGDKRIEFDRGVAGQQVQRQLAADTGGQLDRLAPGPFGGIVEGRGHFGALGGQCTGCRGEGLGGKELPAPQASLMAMLSQGIVGGEMAWPLIIVGIVMGCGFILMQVRSPMLACVGMYLPLETSFAIFVGGLIKGIVERISARRAMNDAQKARIENNGVLLAAGLIAGEALVGLFLASLAIFNVHYEAWIPALIPGLPLAFEWSIAIFVFIALILIFIPLRNAGRPDEPAPPSGVF